MCDQLAGQPTQDPGPAIGDSQKVQQLCGTDGVTSDLNLALLALAPSLSNTPTPLFQPQCYCALAQTHTLPLPTCQSPILISNHPFNKRLKETTSVNLSHAPKEALNAPSSGPPYLALTDRAL